MREIADGVIKAKGIQDDMNVAQRAFADIMGFSSDMTREWKKAQGEVHAIAQANSSSYEEYTAEIDRWNKMVGAGAGYTKAMTVAQYEAKKAGWEWVESLIAQGRELKEFEIAAAAADTATRQTTASIYENNDVLFTGAEEAQAKYTARIRERAAAEEDAAARTQGALGAVSGAVRNIAGAYGEAQAKMDRARAATDELTERMKQNSLDQKAAAEEAARGQAGLITAMEDATQEMFNQQILAAVDPAEIGLDAWATLGQELGLLTAEQVNLGEAAQLAIDAFREGNTDIADAAEFTGALFEEAQKANPQLSDIAINFENAETKGERYKELLAVLNEEQLGPLGEETAPTAAAAIATVGSNSETSAGQVRGLAGAVRGLNTALGEVAPGRGAGPGLPGSYQSGGIVPGPIGAPQLAIVHGGEQIIPVGGTTHNTTHNIGGNTYNVNNPLAAAILAANDMRRRFDDLNARMGTR
jgi:hypothetical protein